MVHSGRRPLGAACFWLKLNIVVGAVTLGRCELKTLRSALVADVGLTDRQECLHRGAGENE
jgi:hypothetical protein